MRGAWARCALAALCLAVGGCRAPRRSPCSSRFEVPQPGRNALTLNGVKLPDTCFSTESPHEVFIIGDWGGVDSGSPSGPVPADHRKSGVHKRKFVDGLDDRAQLAVRDVMRERAAKKPPEYVLNVGDNFYWGGVEAKCGTTRMNPGNFSCQWDRVYEDLYTGDGLDGVQWLGVLGNHDYGGFMYSNAWDQAIWYTWKSTPVRGPGRWVTPAQYWQSTVRYSDFSVDYFFLDSNVFNAYDSPFENMNHNICSFAHNPYINGSVDCSSEAGPVDVFDCVGWFKQLWEEEVDWLRVQLANSSADWQIVVTHFPPCYNKELFANLSEDYGIDLFVTGHLHRQEVHAADASNFMAPTVWAVSGGGGGITSDYMPNVEGDSQYGFMRMSLTKDTIEVVNVMHNGQDGDRATVRHRPCNSCTQGDVRRNLGILEDGLARRGGLLADRETTTVTTSATATTSSSIRTISTTSTTTTSTNAFAASSSPALTFLVYVCSWSGVALAAAAALSLLDSHRIVKGADLTAVGRACVRFASDLLASLRRGSCEEIPAMRSGDPLGALRRRPSSSARSVTVSLGEMPPTEAVIPKHLMCGMCLALGEEMPWPTAADTAADRASEHEGQPLLACEQATSSAAAPAKRRPQACGLLRGLWRLRPGGRG